MFPQKKNKKKMSAVTTEALQKVLYNYCYYGTDTHEHTHITTTNLMSLNKGVIL